MRISIDHIDQAGRRHLRRVEVSYLAFLKHFAVAGQGYLPSVAKLLRVTGSFCWFFDYINPRAFRLGRFGQPPAERYDPTAQGQFSNLAGKAFADILAKRLNGAQHTFAYEAAMAFAGHPITGSRPDLCCVGSGRQFAVEAKGVAESRITAAEMAAYKIQAGSGPLPVHFYMASVAYDFFRSPNCKYHDPLNDNVEFAQSLFVRLTKEYYAGWAEYLDSNLFSVTNAIIEGRDFFVLRPNPETLRFSPVVLWLMDAAILMDTRIRDYAYNESLPETLRVDTSTTFIDSDGIGITLAADRIS